MLHYFAIMDLNLWNMIQSNIHEVKLCVLNMLTIYRCLFCHIRYILILKPIRMKAFYIKFIHYNSILLWFYCYVWSLCCNNSKDQFVITFQFYRNTVCYKFHVLILKLSWTFLCHQFTCIFHTYITLKMIFINL